MAFLTSALRAEVDFIAAPYVDQHLDCGVSVLCEFGADLKSPRWGDRREFGSQCSNHMFVQLAEQYKLETCGCISPSATVEQVLATNFAVPVELRRRPHGIK